MAEPLVLEGDLTLCDYGILPTGYRYDVVEANLVILDEANLYDRLLVALQPAREVREPLWTRPDRYPCGRARITVERLDDNGSDDS